MNLTTGQQRELLYWMQLTRTFDERMILCWKQGRGLGGTFSQRGHEAISVGAAFALEADDVIAPLHRDLGAFLLRGITPRRIFSNLLGKDAGVTRGRDANLHGMGDLEFNIIGFISHLPHSLPVALGAAMSFQYKNEARVAMTFLGEGGSCTGLFHETLNMAGLFNAPLVVIVENNQYAYSTPQTQQMKVQNIACRSASYGMPGLRVDGNDVEAVYSAARESVDRARSGGGPSLIEAVTMRMLGHAIHDNAEYVPLELLREWGTRDPLHRYQEKLLASENILYEELEDIRRRCNVEVEEALALAEASAWPDPATITQGVYAS